MLNGPCAAQFSSGRVRKLIARRPRSGVLDGDQIWNYVSNEIKSCHAGESALLAHTHGDCAWHCDLRRA